MTKLEFLTFDEKLQAAWGLEKTANEHLKIRIDKLTAENERLRSQIESSEDAYVRLDAAMGRLKGALRVNMLRAFPEMSHEEIDTEIVKALGEADD